MISELDGRLTREPVSGRFFSASRCRCDAREPIEAAQRLRKRRNSRRDDGEGSMYELPCAPRSSARLSRLGLHRFPWESDRRSGLDSFPRLRDRLLRGPEQFLNTGGLATVRKAVNDGGENASDLVQLLDSLF
jgi:hypothetical protein